MANNDGFETEDEDEDEEFVYTKRAQIIAEHNLERLRYKCLCASERLKEMEDRNAPAAEMDKQRNYIREQTEYLEGLQSVHDFHLDERAKQLCERAKRQEEDELTAAKAYSNEIDIRMKELEANHRDKMKAISSGKATKATISDTTEKTPKPVSAAEAVRIEADRRMNELVALHTLHQDRMHQIVAERLLEEMNLDDKSGKATKTDKVYVIDISDKEKDYMRI